jgi:trk system potassium uptake protein TrkA
MRVLILGAGNAGRHLAERLCADRHDVVVVDQNNDLLDEIKSQLNVLTICGNGSNPRTLEQADVRKAGLVIAVTSDDEVNILACLLAHKAGVPKTVARVASLDYVHPPESFHLGALGIDLIVSQQEECAHEIFHTLRMPGVVEALDLLGGKLLAVGMQVHMDSPLIRTPLKNFPEPQWLQAIRFIAITRGEERIVPRGDTLPQVGDIIYFTGRSEDITNFMEWAWPERTRFERIVIAGGGELGLKLAQLLEEHTNVQIALIERHEERATFCSKHLNRTLVIHGDALEEDVLKDAGVIKGCAFAAATHDDEKNIFACLLAEKLGAAYTVAQVGKPDYFSIIRRTNLADRIVSPSLSMNSAILHFLRGGYVQEAAVFHDLPGELLDFVVSSKSPWAGKVVKNLKIPDGVILAGVQRGADVLIPTGDLKIAANDRVVIFALPDAIKKVEKFFKQ